MEQLRSTKVIVAVALFSVAALALLALTSAATSSVIVDAEKDGLNRSDSTAFGDSYIEFGRSSTGNQAQDYTFVPDSLDDWEFAPQKSYTASNKTRYVATNGASNGEGTSKTSPISLSRSIAVAQPGDVIYLTPGTYDQRMYVKGLSGTVQKPIVFTTEPGNARKAIIKPTSGSDIGRVILSESLVFDSLVFDGSGRTIWGFVFGQSWTGDTDTGDNSNMKFIGNEIKNNDKEATLKVRRTDGVVVHNNYIHDGTNPKYGSVSGGFGEGMYFGCGNCPASQNTTRNVTVTHNKVQDIGGEGIEFKPGVRNIVATDNLVLDVGYNQRYDSNGSTGFANCCYGGGIVVHPVSNTSFDTNVLLERNRVGRTTAHGIFVGAGNAGVRDNLSWQTGVNHRLGLQNTAPREPFATSNWHNGTFDTVGFYNNHTFEHTTNVLKDDNNYGNSSAINQKANIIKKEIIKHSNQQDAFTAWKNSSF